MAQDATNKVANNDLATEFLLQIRNRTAPLSQRLMMAQGFVPMEAALMLRVLYFLSTFEKEEAVKTAARRTLQELPPATFEVALTDPSTPSEFLDLMSQVREKDDEILAQITQHPKVADKTLRSLAMTSSPKVLERIAVNQSRLINKPQLIDLMLQNPRISRLLDSGLHEFKELFQEEIRKASLTREQHAPKPVAQPVKSAPATQKQPLKAQPVLQAKSADGVDAISDLTTSDSLGNQKVLTGSQAAVLEEYDFEEDLKEIEAVEGEEDDEDEITSELSEEKIRDVRMRLRSLPMSDKLLRAQMGSKQERYILMRDPSSKIALAAVKSPKITEFEIELAAKCRSICEEVLREIAVDRNWSQKYSVVSGLVGNPKTPPAVSLKLLSRLHERDLKELEGDKDISYGVRAAAKRLYELRQKRKH